MCVLKNVIYIQAEAAFKWFKYIIKYAAWSWATRKFCRNCKAVKSSSHLHPMHVCLLYNSDNLIILSAANKTHHFILGTDAFLKNACCVQSVVVHLCSVWRL